MHWGYGTTWGIGVRDPEAVGAAGQAVAGRGGVRCRGVEHVLRPARSDGPVRTALAIPAGRARARPLLPPGLRDRHRVGARRYRPAFRLATSGGKPSARTDDGLGS